MRLSFALHIQKKKLESGIMTWTYLCNQKLQTELCKFWFGVSDRWIGDGQRRLPTPNSEKLNQERVISYKFFYEFGFNQSINFIKLGVRKILNMEILNIWKTLNARNIN